MEAPKFDQLIWPTIKALKALGGSGTNQEIVDKIIELENYSNEVQSIIHKGNITKIEYNAAWARTWLKKYEAIENSARATWTLLNKGEGFKKGDVAAVLKTVRASLSNQEKIDDNEINLEIDEEFTQEWRQNLLDVLYQMNPFDFEKLCQLLLRSSGFSSVEVTSKTGDGGIDGKGILRVNLLSFHVSFQCKRYKKSVSSPDIRDFRGAFIGRADKGLFITTGTFTAEARKEAFRDGAPPIDLIDGDMLCDLLKTQKLGVKTELIEKVTIDNEWFNKI